MRSAEIQMMWYKQDELGQYWQKSTWGKKTDSLCIQIFNIRKHIFHQWVTNRSTGEQAFASIYRDLKLKSIQITTQFRSEGFSIFFKKRMKEIGLNLFEWTNGLVDFYHLTLKWYTLRTSTTMCQVPFPSSTAYSSQNNKSRKFEQLIDWILSVKSIPV